MSTMNRTILLPALLLAALPAASQSPTTLPKLTLAQETALRCSAAFGLVAYDQQRKAPGADLYPPLGERGREYFVRTTARLMDETGASEAQVATLLKLRVEELQAGAIKAKDPKEFVGRIVHSCLPLLDAEVPPAGGR